MLSEKIKMLWHRKTEDVLILVVVEDAQWERWGILGNKDRYVLILVVVEDAQWAVWGTYTQKRDLSLNPCCSGRCSVRPLPSASSTARASVLILVVVEDAQWESDLESYKGEDLVSLNPCCSGRCSVRGIFVKICVWAYWDCLLCYWMLLQREKCTFKVICHTLMFHVCKGSICRQYFKDL